MKSVLTIAVGKKIYVEMACNLAMSYLLWNKNNDIKFYLVTDNPVNIPLEIKKNIEIIEIDTKEFDSGFSIKLHLDKFLRTTETLFIDCDCLIYGNLLPVFEKFNGSNFSVIGERRKEGEFFCNIESIREKFDLAFLTWFVGSIYYIKKSTLTEEIFKLARDLKPNYDEIGLIRLRDKENEEPLLSIAMSKFNENPIPDDGSIKADRMFYTFINSNILKPFASLKNNINQLPLPEYSKLLISKPLIIHFNASYAENFEYKTEVMRLNIYFNFKPLLFLSDYIVNIAIYYPGYLKKLFIQSFRPIYHKLFGTRKIKKTLR